MAKIKKKIEDHSGEYLLSMSHAPSIDQSASLLHMIPIACFAALVILVVRMHTYTRPMTQFFWTTGSDTDTITDFFSYDKMVLICVAAVIALLMILFRITTQSLAVKRCYAYIPMGVYSLFVILSYAFSKYKEFALWGWNDRFEGTIPLLCYMIMLMLIINSVNTEENIKQVVIPIAISATILSIIGLTQALDHDFFRTVLGQKLLVPNQLLTDGTTTWQQIEAAAAQGELYLKFTFNNKEIYQTVYNINYVSFYLTLLVPLYTMLFIRAINDKSSSIVKKIVLGVLVALLTFNLIGSQSSGGYLGIGVAAILAIIVFNKQFLKWVKPLIIIVVILAIVMGATLDRWWPEISGAVKSVLGIKSEVAVEETEQKEEAKGPGAKAPTIEYIETGSNTITMSLNNEELIIAVDTNGDVITGINVCDGEGTVLEMIPIDDGLYAINDQRFYDYATIAVAYDGETYFIQVSTAGTPWNFISRNGEIYFDAQTAKTVKLSKIETWGFKNNPDFGSGRGAIWATSFPLLKKTVLIGTGADTYCAVYPQEDYAYKWTRNGNTPDNLYLIVDKPHNMYIHAAVGTGVISLIALVALYGIYLVQSVKLFWKRNLENDFLLFAGAGTFLGVTGFLVSGLVDDSTVSVMPLFYTFLGMGIAINMIIKRRDEIGAVKEK
ncbi:MAG: O-antigen ligase family protein [Clostridia bacterium]|nr:O-antigen ligase family protein [Clostridia bacterium]